jgi:hypothetical protein
MAKRKAAEGFSATRGGRPPLTPPGKRGKRLVVTDLGPEALEALGRVRAELKDVRGREVPEAEAVRVALRFAGRAEVLPLLRKLEGGGG